MAIKNVKGVSIPRHDIAENWSKAVNFVPSKGELIIYDADTTSYSGTVDIGGTLYTYESSDKVRFKFGDGVCNVNVLPFATTEVDLSGYATEEWVKEYVDENGGTGEYYPATLTKETISCDVEGQTLLVPKEIDLTLGNILVYELGVLLSENEHYSITTDGIVLDNPANIDDVFTVVQLTGTGASSVANVLEQAKTYTDEKTAPATDIAYGTVKVCTNANMALINNGIYMRGDGALTFVSANEESISNKSPYAPITPAILDYAVKSVGDGYYAKTEDLPKESNIYPDCFYRTSSRGFTEWINAPMIPGVEYLTTERHNGEPVWIKLFEGGSIQNRTAVDQEGNVLYYFHPIAGIVHTGSIFWSDVWLIPTTGDGSIYRAPTAGDPDSFRILHTEIHRGGLRLSSSEALPSNYNVQGLVKFTRPNTYTQPIREEWERCMLDRIDMSMKEIVIQSDLNLSIEKGVVHGILFSDVCIPDSSYPDSAYSRYNRLVGTGTTLSTYYSALENPASLMYTLGDIDPSTDERNTYYGSSESGFVSYALGFGEWVCTKKLGGVDGSSWYSENIKQVVIPNYVDSDPGYHPETEEEETAYENKQEVIDHLNNNVKPYLPSVKRGDLIISTLNKECLDHNNSVKLVKDVLYDKKGNLYGFYVSEYLTKSRYCAYFVFLTPEQFASLMVPNSSNSFQPYGVIRCKSSSINKTGVEEISYSKSIYPNKGDGGKYTIDGKIRRFTGEDLTIEPDAGLYITKTVKENNVDVTHYYPYEEIDDSIQLYIPDTNATTITITELTRTPQEITTYELAELDATTVNDVTVYNLEIGVPGTYTIATDTAPYDQCTIIVEMDTTEGE